MKGKVVELKRIAGSAGLYRENCPWEKILECIRPRIEEVDIYLERAVSKAPELIRNTLWRLALDDKRLVPALFLTVAGLNYTGNHKSRLAASLQSLQLAIQAHCSLEEPALTPTPTEVILSGDFYFSLALTAAADIPIFIMGMAEIINRVASSIVCKPHYQTYSSGLRQRYLQHISDSHASIIALAASLGAWYAKLSPRQNEALAYFGHYLGMGLEIREEFALFEADLKQKAGTPRLTLPLAYILEQSPSGRELFKALDHTAIEFDYRLLEQEKERTDLEGFISRVAANCFSKASEFLDSLQANLEQETLAVLRQFIFLK
ncbi:MAG: hypothetical protein AB1767_04910 [Bacillota bacterium]